MELATSMAVGLVALDNPKVIRLLEVVAHPPYLGARTSPWGQRTHQAQVDGALLPCALCRMDSSTAVPEQRLCTT